EAWNNRGDALLKLHCLDEALTSYDKAITLKPDYADAKFNKSLCQLLQGDFSRGWLGYEQRWLRKEADPRRHGVRPLWLGAEELSGRTILLHAEQGLGDTIQFLRYAPLVAQRGAKILLEVQAPLKDVAKTLPCEAEVF